MSGQRADARKRVEQPEEILLSPDELAEAERDMVADLVREQEWRRDVTRLALEDVYAGAGYVEADALLSKLADRGARVVVDE